MSPFEQFKLKAGVPAGFGETLPYVRLASVDHGDVDSVGADADIEFDGDQNCVKVTVTEWERSTTGTDRNQVLYVVFDLATGQIVDDEGDGLSDLLVAIDGMRVLGGEVDA